MSNDSGLVVKRITFQAEPLSAAQTIARITDALAHSETACVTQVLEIIQEMSNRADRLSVQDLAEIIGRDLTTVTKIMRAANCLGYNPGAVDVTTLTEAIYVIGFERIRNLAISLLLIENAEKRLGGRETQDVAALALTSGLLSQAVVQGTTALNSDQAFVCAALRHYGKLLLSTFLPEGYREALSLSREMGFDAACRMRFGISALSLGRHILSEGHLPKVIGHCLLDATVGMAESDTLSEQDRLLVIAEFSSRVCELIASPETTEADFEAGLTRLVKTYSNSVSLTSKDVKKMLAAVDQMIGMVGRAEGLQTLSSPLIARIHQLAEGRGFSPSKTARISSDAGNGGPQRLDPFVAGVAEVRRLAAASPMDFRQVFAAAARTVSEGLELQSCLIFLKEDAGSMYAPRLGVGPCFEATQDAPVLNPRQKDVFTVCLSRGEDVLIQDPYDSRIAPFVPSWFKELPEPGPFVLLPVRDAQGTFAILCGIGEPGEKIDLNGTRLQHIKALRTVLAALRAAVEHPMAA